MDIQSWNVLKTFSRSELESLLPSDVRFKTKPWKHQIAAFLACVDNPGFLSALDLGTGKTKVAIDTCEYLLGYGQDFKVLAIVLNSAVENWADEVADHSDSSSICLRGAGSEKWDLLSDIDGINYSIVNYEGLRAMLTKPKTNKLGQKTKGIKVDMVAVNRLLKIGWDAIVYDESHLLKNSRSLNFEIAKLLCSRIDLRLLLTGTPIGNNLLGIWSQYYLMDFGETYNASFGIFRKAYFLEKPVYGRGRKLIKWAKKYEVTESGKRIITNKMYRKAIRYGEWEVDDLPPKVYRSILYSLSAEQEAAYAEWIEVLEDDDFDDTILKSTGSIVNFTMPFRQLCSGFIKGTGYVFKKNPKLEVLKDLIENVVEDNEVKVVVFTEFIYSVGAISAMLKKIKVKHRVLDGSTKNEDKYKMYSTFNNDPKYRVLVANIRSGGASINLVSATYCVFYENGQSVINRKQAEKRIHRGGQTEKCFFYDLVGRDTVEITMRYKLKAGLNAFDEAVDNTTLKRRLRGSLK